MLLVVISRQNVQLCYYVTTRLFIRMWLITKQHSFAQTIKKVKYWIFET